MHTLRISTTARSQMRDITSQVRDLVRAGGWGSGALALFCPHTTCALTINEGADPDVAADMTRFFNGLVPKNGDFRHAEGNSDAHIKTSLLGPSLLVLVEGGKLMLGTWQSIYLFEGDGPRERQVWAQWLPGEGDRGAD